MSADHLKLPSSMVKYLKKSTKRFYTNDIVQHMQLLSSINQCESLNQSIATIQLWINHNDRDIN